MRAKPRCGCKTHCWDLGEPEATVRRQDHERQRKRKYSSLGKKNKRLEQLNAMCNPGLDSEPENKFPSFSMEEIQPGSEDPIVLQ